MPSNRNTQTSVRSTIIAAASPTAPTASSVASSTPPPALLTSSLLSTLSMPSVRSIRSIDDLIAEQLVQPLPLFSATNLQEFMSWAYLIFHHFHLIPGFTREIFDKPRSEISFGAVPEDRVDSIYFILWDKLYPIVNARKGVQSMMATIPRDEVHSLWKVLKPGFCLQSSMKISERGRSFFGMCQGNESVTSFTTSVLVEKDILKFLGEVKSYADVKAVVIGELATDDAKAFAFRLVHLTLPEFISEVISYDMLISYQRKSRVSSTPCARSSN